MNLIIVEPDDFANNSQVVLRGRRAEHILSVHRVTPGQKLKIGVLNGNIGSAEVLNADQTEVSLCLELDQPPPPPLPVTLIVAMQRPKTMKKILQAATAAGVKKFFIIESWKVEKSYWTTPLLENQALKEQFILGLEQGVDTVLPEVCIRRRFKPFVEDELAALAGESLKLIAHPGAETPCPHQTEKPVTLCIGPEGGFTPYEVEKIVAQGFLPVNLGMRIMRSEFAVSAALAKLF
jgi:RsmE family RNA methyltransferase